MSPWVWYLYLGLTRIWQDFHINNTPPSMSIHPWSIWQVVHILIYDCRSLWGIQISVFGKEQCHLLYFWVLKALLGVWQWYHKTNMAPWCLHTCPYIPEDGYTCSSSSIMFACCQCHFHFTKSIAAQSKIILHYISSVPHELNLEKKSPPYPLNVHVTEDWSWQFVPSLSILAIMVNLFTEVSEGNSNMCALAGLVHSHRN